MNTAELWIQYKKEPTKELKKEIIIKYLKLIHYVINQTNLIDTRLTEKKDYFQIGVEGLCQAIERFDPEYGTKFETYAILRIRGKIFDEIRKYKIRSSSENEILQNYHTISLEQKNYNNDTFNLCEVLPSQEMGIEEQMIIKEQQKYLIHIINTFNKREKKILMLYYYKNLGYKDIAEIYGVSISRISQIHSKIIFEIKEKLESNYEMN